MSEFVNRVLLGDCSKLLCDIPSESVDLIATSPPYGNKRKASYGGVDPDRYVEWFLPISRELFRILKPTGSFFLNIKEGTTANGGRHLYVLELIIAMTKQQGWINTDYYALTKPNPFPGKWPNRFRNAWEWGLHFTKQKHFYMDQEAVMVPTGEWAKTRLNRQKANDNKHTRSKNGSGCARKEENWLGREFAYPTNVLCFPTGRTYKNHSAMACGKVFAWFIKLLSKPGDLVLDPFMGSGTTAIEALKLGRNYLGIEKSRKYHHLASDYIAEEMRGLSERLRQRADELDKEVNDLNSEIGFLHDQIANELDKWVVGGLVKKVSGKKLRIEKNVAYVRELRLQIEYLETKCLGV